MVTTQRKTKKCTACYRQVVDKGKEYCIYHIQAYDSLQKQYNIWVNAYGGISQKDYMKKLLTLDETGSWVKDVINIELRAKKKISNELKEIRVAYHNYRPGLVYQKKNNKKERRGEKRKELCVPD